MFHHQLQKKFSHFFRSEEGGVSPDQIVRAGLTFSVAAGALGVLAGSAQASACDPCPRYVCDSSVSLDWTCENDCSVRTYGEDWVEICSGQDCVKSGSTGSCS